MHALKVEQNDVLYHWHHLRCVFVGQLWLDVSKCFPKARCVPSLGYGMVNAWTVPISSGSGTQEGSKNTGMVPCSVWISETTISSVGQTSSGRSLKLADRRGFEPRTCGLGGRRPILARLPVHCPLFHRGEGYLKFTVYFGW